MHYADIDYMLLYYTPREGLRRPATHCFWKNNIEQTNKQTNKQTVSNTFPGPL